MDGVYQNLLAAFNKQIKNGDELDRTFAGLHKKALIEAERAWIRWRDSEAEFRARFSGAVGGSALGEDIDTNLLEMINQRTEFLQKCLDELKTDSATQSTSPPYELAARAQNVETVTSSDIQSGAANFNGQIREGPKEALFQQYGTDAATAFQKHPELVSSLKKLNLNFDPAGMSNYASTVFTLNGRTFLILRGCSPDNCNKTMQIVAFEPSTNLVYLIQQTNVGGRFNLYGNPDKSVRTAIYSAYRPYLD